MPSVDDSIQFVKGIGPKKAKLLEKLHIRTLRDALETYPRDYEDRTHITPIAEIDMEDKYAVRAVVGTEPKVNRIRKGLTLVKCTIYDETGTLNVTYFNNPYAAAQLRVGQEYVFYGKVQGFGRGRTMVSPQSERVAPDADHPGRIVPVYPLTAGLTQRDLERITAAALSAKGGSPHVLVMSATPIPRTLALIMYGDLDVSVLDEIPPGRSPVETYAVGENMRKRITAFIDKQVGLGGQAYVVCPLIEDSENAETKLKSAEQHAKDLQKLLPHRRVAVLHGRMKNAEKDQIMRDFAAQKYDILVATTVIEVGVDVPNANLMVVEDADRFGLSQLHQLRGRVGRGTRQSYCVFFGADKGQVARERLRILCRTGDGFEVARADLAQRGPGDFFGQRQHGLPALHVADLAADLALMQNAREEAEALLAADPTLAGYPILLDRVQRMFAEQNDEAFN